MEWEPIETAPTNKGVERRDDPAWFDPPKLLLWVPEESEVIIGYWDMCYADGGFEHEPQMSGWVWEGIGPLDVTPTHWMPLPPPPHQGDKR